MENLTYILNRDVIRITKIGMLEVGGTDGDLLVDGFPDYLKSGSNIKVFDEMNQESHIMLHNDAGIKALTFCVQSETDEDIVMTTRSNFTYKLWVNGSLAGYVGTATDPLVITKARKGVNIFMLEIDGVYIDGFVALRLSRYAYETQMQYDRLIWGNLSLFSKKAVLLTAKGQISEASILKYLLVANDSVSLSLDQKAQLKIFTKIGMKLIYDSECVFNQADGIDLSSLIQAAEGECIISCE